MLFLQLCCFCDFQQIDVGNDFRSRELEGRKGSGDLIAEFDALFKISVPIEPDALVEFSVLIFGRLAPPSLPRCPVPKIIASEH